MYLKAKPFFIEVKTPLHAGSGSELGVIDLPVQREKITNYPKIESSSLKGSLREAFSSAEKSNVWKNILGDLLNENKIDYKNMLNAMFGPDSGENEGENYRGVLSFTEARLLFFPIKSLKGVFVWATSPMILQRFKDELSIAGITGSFEIPEPHTVSDKSILIDGTLIIEDYAINNMEETNKVKSFAKFLKDQLNMEEISERLVILEDEELRDFVSFSTEVIARTKINSDTGTVQEGALWYEEFVPENTIFYFLTLSTPIFSSKSNGEDFKKLRSKPPKDQASLMLECFENGVKEFKYFQIGGDATIGKGICELKTIDNVGKGGKNVQS